MIRAIALLERYGLLFILGVFSIVGMIGITYHFGFPIAVNDETPPLAAALKMLAEPSLRPDFPTFYYMPLSAYLVLPFAGVGLAVAYLFGDIGSLAELERFVLLDFAKLLPAVRVASVAFGALSIFLLFQLIEILYRSRRLALAGAGLLASSLMFIQLSHFGRVWSMQLAFMLLSLVFTARIWRDGGDVRAYVRSALAAGIAFGINFVGVIAAAALFAAHALRERKAAFGSIVKDRRLLAALGTLGGLVPAMYLLNPYGFSNYLAYAKKLAGVVADIGGTLPVARAAETEATGDGAGYYLWMFFEYDPALALLACMGMLAWFRASRSVFAWLIVYGAAYLGTITMLSQLEVIAFEPRYALPLYPLAAIAGAFGMREFFLLHRAHPRILPVIAVIAILAIAIPMLWISRVTLPATRVDALSWVEQHVPNNEGIVTTDDRIPFPENLESLQGIASETPRFMTRKRAWLLEHPDATAVPAFQVAYTAYGTSTMDARMEPEYALVSWWNPDDRAERLLELAPFMDGRTLEHVVRFPSDADDRTESIDLANNMRAPAWKLWGLRQNGPVVDIYRIVSVEGEDSTSI